MLAPLRAACWACGETISKTLSKTHCRGEQDGKNEIEHRHPELAPSVGACPTCGGHSFLLVFVQRPLLAVTNERVQDDVLCPLAYNRRRARVRVPVLLPGKQDTCPTGPVGVAFWPGAELGPTSNRAEPTSARLARWHRAGLERIGRGGLGPSSGWAPPLREVSRRNSRCRWYLSP